MELDRRTWRSARRDTQRPRGRGAGRPDTQQRLDRWTTTGVQSNCPDLRKPQTPWDQGPTRARENKAEGKGARCAAPTRGPAARRGPEAASGRRAGAQKGSRGGPRLPATVDVGGSPAPGHLHDHTDRARHLAPSRGPGLGEAASRGATLPRPLEDTGEAALQTRPARGWPVSLTVMNHGRGHGQGLAQEGPGWRGPAEPEAGERTRGRRVGVRAVKAAGPATAPNTVWEHLNRKTEPPGRVTNRTVLGPV